MPVLTKPVSCEGCPLIKAPGPVMGIGSPNAKLIYISLYPGQHEVNAIPMQPMVGPGGSVFKRQLAEAGLRLDEVYVTNQVKCLPGPDGPDPLTVSKCRPILESELGRCKGDTVVLSGDLPFRQNIGDYSTIRSDYHPKVGKGKAAKPAGVMMRMGCVEQKDGRKWIGTPQPVFLMRNPKMREAGPLHLKKAAQVAGFPLPKVKIRTHVTDQEVLEFVDKTILGTREFADDVETVGIGDIEEDDYVGGDWLMTMIGVANSPWESLVLDPRQTSLLQPIFTDPEIWRYEHNGEYDNYYIERYIPAQIMANRKHDTMQGTHWLRNQSPKKLKPFVLSVYTWLPYYNRDLGNVDERLYNGMDLVTTFQAAKEQRRQLKNLHLEEIFYKLGQPILPILEEWRRVGLRVDLRRALLFKRIIEDKVAKAQVLIAKVAGPLFNPGSPKQVAQLLYEGYKLPTQYNITREKGKEIKHVTTDYEARKRLRHWVEADENRMAEFKMAHTLLNLLDFISGEEKKLEYIGRISPDGKLHPAYKAHGQETFRLASVPSVVNIPVYDISAWGGARRDDNDTAQNPISEVDKDEERELGAKDKPKLGSLRSLVLPDQEGDLLLSCDFEQMQLWILAAQFKVKWLLDIFESGEYFYGVVFEKLYNEPFFQAGKPRTKKFKLPISEQRIRRVKAVPLGFVFNRTGAAVAQEYGWPVSEGVQYRRWFMDNCKELEPAYSKLEFAIKQKGLYRHAAGQLAHYAEGKSTAAINACAQSNEAMIVRESIIMINEEFVRRGWKPRHVGVAPFKPMTRTCLSVHDSITTNINMERGAGHLVEVYEEVIKPILSRPIPWLNGFQFRHSAEVSTMWDWNVVDYSQWKVGQDL